MTPHDTASSTRARKTPRRTKATGWPRVGEVLGMIVLVAAIWLYQAVAWILMLAGTIGGVIVVGGFTNADADRAQLLIWGAVCLAAVAVGVFLVLLFIRNTGARFWETIPFTPGPGF